MNFIGMLKIKHLSYPPREVKYKKELTFIIESCYFYKPKSFQLPFTSCEIEVFLYRKNFNILAGNI
jgi:hypothetical protein